MCKIIIRMCNSIQFSVRVQQPNSHTVLPNEPVGATRKVIIACRVL